MNIMKIIIITLFTFALSKKFLERGQNYQDPIARSYFQYTKIVTCTLEDIQYWTCGYYCDAHPGMQEVQAFYNPAHSAQAFCGYNLIENLIVITYRSTQDITNFLNDLRFLKSEFGDCTNCYVHTGFLETYKDLSQLVMDCASNVKRKHPYAKTLIAGHSLGGAIAALAAVDYTRLGYQVDYFFTYGSPRVGTPEFSQWFKDYVNPTESWRITHNKDIVVHNPPSAFGYLHIPQETWYDKDSTAFIVCETGFDEDPQCANQFYFPDSISDHTSYFNEFQPCRVQFNPE